MFAGMFPDPLSASQVVASVGLPREDQPGWTGGLSAVGWWSEVLRLLEAGKVVDGLQRLHHEARRQFPDNPIFVAIEGVEGAEDASPGGAPGQRPRTAGVPAVGVAAQGRRMTGLPVPYPSDKFIPRPAVEEAAVRALVDTTRGSRGLIVALTGMSGSGKTLSAQHVANDPRVRERFPDGVCWLDGRDTPSATSCQIRIFRALGELPPDTTASFRPLLQERLAELRCLIVLDNLVSHKLIESLDVVGRDGAILVTTTDREIVPYGAVVCEVQHFDLDGSYELLKEYSSSADTVLPQDVAKVADQCGGLPLALAICGAMVGSGHGWDEVVSLLESADLGALKQRFRDYPNHSLLAALEVGVGVLAPDERAAYGDLVVFTGCGPVPVTAAWRVWSRRGLSKLQSQIMIKNLSQRSLLTYRDEDATFTLHELLYQYLLVATGDELPRLHAHLAQTYLQDWGGLDAALPSAHHGDEYGLTHLAFHLERGDLDETLHQLLALEAPARSASTVNRWFAVLEQAGFAHHYLADVDRAWRCAQRTTDHATEVEELAASRALEMHYALVTSSVVGIAANVPTPLLSAMVQRGVWSFATAWAYCGMVANPLGRARALAALARLPAPPGIDRALLLTHASVAAAAVEKGTDRAWIFAALIPCVPADDRPALFEAAMAATGGRPQSPVWLLARLARHVPDLVRPSLLADAHSKPALATDISALVLASRWLPELRAPLRARIAELHHPHWQMCLLLSMLIGASEPERSGLLADAQTLAAELNASVDGAGAAARTAETANKLTDLLAALLSDRGDDELRIDALRALLAELPEDDQQAVINTVVATVRRRGPTVDAALARLALSHLSDSDRPALINEVIGNDTDVNALCTLAPFLPHHHLDHAVDLACGLTSETLRGRALDKLAPHLPVDLLRRALQTVLELDTPAQRAKALVRLAPHLTAPGRQRVLAVASEVDDSDTRVDLLTDLAACLPPASVPAIVDVVPPDASPLARVTIFSQLAARTVSPLREKITTQLLDAARAVSLHSSELRSLLEGLTDPRRIGAVFVLQQSLDSPRHAVDDTTLVALAPVLPAGTVDRAAHIVRAMSSACQRSHGFTTLTFCTQGPPRAALLSDAVQAACADHDHDDATFCHVESRLMRAIRHVPDTERLPLAKEFVARILAKQHSSTDPTDKDPDRRRRQLACLAAYLPKYRADAVRATASTEVEATIPAPYGRPDEHDERLRRAMNKAYRPPTEDRQKSRVNTVAPSTPAASLYGPGIIQEIVTRRVHATTTANLARTTNPSQPDFWPLWRQAIADAAAVDRPTTLTLTVDACLALADISSPTEVKATAIHLVQHLFTVNAWWSGATRSHGSTKMWHDAAEMAISFIMSNESIRDPWISEHSR